MEIAGYKYGEVDMEWNGEDREWGGEMDGMMEVMGERSKGEIRQVEVGALLWRWA